MPRMSPDEREEMTRQNRNYLAQHEAIGDISLRKSPYEASARYVNRVANNLRQQEQAGLPLDVGAGRGHARKEHGKPRNPAMMKAVPEAYEVVRKVNQIPGATVTARGEIILPHSERIEQYLTIVAREASDTRIVIEMDEVNLFKHGGIRPEEVQRIIREDYEGDADAFFLEEKRKQDKQSPKRQKKRSQEREREHSRRKRERAKAKARR